MVSLGFRKLCAQWVPKELNDVYRVQRMGLACTIGERRMNFWTESGDQGRDMGSVHEFREGGTVQAADAHSVSVHAQEFKQTIWNRQMMATVF